MARKKKKRKKLGDFSAAEFLLWVLWLAGCDRFMVYKLGFRSRYVLSGFFLGTKGVFVEAPIVVQLLRIF